jgi:hypothetical protein
MDVTLGIAKKILRVTVETPGSVNMCNEEW